MQVSDSYLKDEKDMEANVLLHLLSHSRMNRYHNSVSAFELATESVTLKLISVCYSVSL